MLTQLTGQGLPQRMADFRSAGLPGVSSFAKGLEQDLDAVTNGTTMPWNPGPRRRSRKSLLSLSSARCPAAPDSRFSTSDASMILRTGAVPGVVTLSLWRDWALEGIRKLMSELLRWQTEGGSVIIEVDSNDPGLASIARPFDEIADVKERFEGALDNVRAAAVSALKTFRDKSLAPDEVSLEFGVKFNASAGAVIAKTSAEGNLAVRLTWAASHSERGE
jgi:Trypsin-co-occurring domain 1